AEQGHQGAHAEAVLGLAAQALDLVAAAVVGADRRQRLAGQTNGVLGLVLDLLSGEVAKVELGGEELEAALHGPPYRYLQDGRVGGVQLLFREDDVPGHDFLGTNAIFDADEEVTEEAGVEIQRLDDHVDAVLEGFDDLVGAAAQVVVGGQEPGTFRALDGLAENLGVAVGH